jgi:hypothetical protein
MTQFEIELATALANCSFLLGSSQKRFCRNMGDLAKYSPEKELSLRQRHYMEIMAWRYRRQLSERFIPHSKPLNLPRPITVTKAKRPKKVEPLREADLFNKP